MFHNYQVSRDGSVFINRKYTRSFFGYNHLVVNDMYRANNVYTVTELAKRRVKSNFNRLRVCNVSIEVRSFGP